MARLVIAAFLAFTATTSQAQVQVPLIMHCGSYEPLAALLTKDHGENILHSGETGAGHEVQHWLNTETGGWSIVLKDGLRGCLVATGEKFTPGGKKPDHPS